MEETRGIRNTLPIVGEVGQIAVGSRVDDWVVGGLFAGCGGRLVGWHG